MLGRALLHPQDCSTLPLILSLLCGVLSKVTSSTIFWVFGLTQPGIKPQSPGPLVNTLLIRPMDYLLSHEISSYCVRHRGKNDVLEHVKFKWKEKNYLFILFIYMCVCFLVIAENKEISRIIPLFQIPETQISLLQTFKNIFTFLWIVFHDCFSSILSNV